jgi:hypothetical protein
MLIKTKEWGGTVKTIKQKSGKKRMDRMGLLLWALFWLNTRSALGRKRGLTCVVANHGRDDKR